MPTIIRRYLAYCGTQGLDIAEHLPTLKLVSYNKEVIELGVRGIVSTWAFLAAKPKKLLSVDIKHPHEYGGNLEETEKAAEEAGIPFEFKLHDSLTINLPECDILFIDTLHTKEQLSKELALHADKARELIIMHDTNPMEFPEMSEAIAGFLDTNQKWKYEAEWLNNHGLTILRRV